MATPGHKTQKSQSLSLPLDDGNLPLPAASNRRSTDASAKGKRGKGTPRKAGANPQAFLPGMSRRGRPRAKAALSATERAANSRHRRRALGAKRVELVLDAEALEKLDALAEHLKETRAGVVRWLLVRAAGRLLTPKR